MVATNGESKTAAFEVLQTQFFDSLKYYKEGRFADAVGGSTTLCSETGFLAAQFKFTQQRASQMQSVASSPDETAALGKIMIESARNKGHGYFGLSKKGKAYSAFCESYSLAKATSDRGSMARALVGMSRTYECNSLQDTTGVSYAEQALALAKALYSETLDRFRAEAPPLLLPPFGAGSGPLLNTLRNKLYVGELDDSHGNHLHGQLAEAQSLLTLTQDAIGKARKSAW